MEPWPGSAPGRPPPARPFWTLYGATIPRNFSGRPPPGLWACGETGESHTACTAGASQAQPDVMERARAFIRDNFVNPELTLKTVADYVGFNEKYFSTRFAKECGCTFISYLNGLRIERAGQLLLQTDMKIYEVCEAVGYHNVEHFNHVFKKKMGVMPKIYRQSGENI